MKGLLVVSALLVGPRTLVAQSTSTGEKSAVDDEANRHNHMVVVKHEGNAIESTVERLGQGIPIECENAPLSEMIDYVSTATNLRFRFRFESTDMLSRPVTMSSGGQLVKTHDVLTSLFDHFGYEMSVLSNGEILVTPAQPVSAMRRYVAMLTKSPQQVNWRERSKMMTENGVMEQGGNVVWFCLETRHDNSVDARIRDSVASELSLYGLSDLQKPSGPPPYAQRLSKDARERACSLRNKLFTGVMGQLKTRTFALLDELESTLSQSGISLPWHDIRAVGNYFVYDRLASVGIRTSDREYLLNFRKVGDDWLFDGTEYGN